MAQKHVKKLFLYLKRPNRGLGGMGEVVVVVVVKDQTFSVFFFRHPSLIVLILK